MLTQDVLSCYTSFLSFVWLARFFKLVEELKTWWFVKFQSNFIVLLPVKEQIMMSRRYTLTIPLGRL